MVQERRLELPRAYAHYPLKVARLPIPPSGHTVCRKYGNRECKCNENSAICNSLLPNFPVPGEFFEIARSVFRVRSGDPRTKRNAETDNRGQCSSPPDGNRQTTPSAARIARIARIARDEPPPTAACRIARSSRRRTNAQAGTRTARRTAASSRHEIERIARPLRV